VAFARTADASRESGQLFDRDKKAQWTRGARYIHELIAYQMEGHGAKAQAGSFGTEHRTPHAAAVRLLARAPSP